MSLSLPAQGYLNRQTAPLVRAGSDSLKAIAALLGAGQAPFKFSPDQVRSTETFTLQRLAEGRAEYLGYSITAAMQSSNAVMINLMPMMRTDAIKGIREYWAFPKALAIATPAQAPPSYVEVEKREHSFSLERYALGATTTVQELRTAEGQFIFRGKLITVAVAFIDVAELLAIDALLTIPSLYAQYYIESGQHPIDLQRTGRMTDLYWDILRSRDNGMAELLDMVRQSMNAQNIAPTHIIMTEGMRSLMMASSQKTEYNRNGPGAAENALRLGDAIGDDIDGVRLIVVRAIELRKQDLRVAPLERKTIIGQHFRLAHYYELCDLDDWCSKWFSFQFVSQSSASNGWQTITMMDALESDGRFAADGRLSNWHYELAANLNDKLKTSGVPLYDDQYDMFIYISRTLDAALPVANVCELWGHMEKWALTPETIERTVTTSINAMKEALPSVAIEAVRLGQEDMKELADRVPTAADIDFLDDEGDIGFYGIRKLPTERPDGIADNYVPAGYNSGMGYLELATSGDNAAYLDRNYVDRAKAFKKAVMQLHSFFVQLYTMAHPALDPANAPAAYRAYVANRSQTASTQKIGSLLAFIHNIIDTPKNNVVIVSASAAGAAAGAPASTADIEPIEEGTTFDTLNDMFQEAGPIPSLVEALGSPERIERFAEAFGQSTFARRYAAYVTAQRAAAAAASASRRTRAATSALSTDADAADALEAGEAGVPGESQLARFHRREVVGMGLNALQAASLYSHVIAAVRENKAPTVVTADVLRAWARDDAALQRGTAQRAAAGVTEIPAGGRQTAYTISIDALRNATPEVRERVQMLSALNPGRVVDLDTAADEAAANTDLLATTLVQSQARPSPVAGVRDTAAPLQAPASSIFGGANGALPTFAGTAFTDIVGDQVVVNTNIRDRFGFFANNPNSWKRVHGQMFVTAPIMRIVLENFWRLNVASPVEWLIEQFNRRYRTASMIFISKPTNRDFGNIRYMDFDTHIGRNAVNKNLMVHVSGYMGATPEDAQDWFVAHDVAVIGYDGGENGVAFNQDTWNLNSLDKLGLDGPSLLYFMEPAGSLVGGKDLGKTPLTHDIRGYNDPMSQRGQERFVDGQFAVRPQHKSALFYTSKLGLNRLVTPQSADWFRFHRRDGTFNTVTQQGLQRIVDPHTGNYEQFIQSSDPFKDNVYPGDLALRDSALPRMYDKVDYKTKAIAV